MFQELEKAWTHDSGGYDELIKKQLSNRRHVAHWSNELRNTLGDEPLKILDIGCGPGFFSILLARLGHDVKAIDGSEGMVNCAAGNFAAEERKISVALEDAVALPEEKEKTYDVIISRDVVWTLYDPEKAFRRWREVLKLGGRVVIYDGNYRRDRTSAKMVVWKGFSQILSVVTERKLPDKKAHHDKEGVFSELPMVVSDRPQKDRELLREAGYRRIRVTNDSYRNSPKHLEFWKYGYQGKKFRIIAWK